MKSIFNSGIQRVADIKIINGIIDDNFLYDKVKDKRNIFREITILRRALKTFTQVVVSHDPSQHEQEQISSSFEIPRKSTSFYQNLIQGKIVKPKFKIFTQNNISVINFASIFRYKIKKINEPKLAEFNYKVINNILPCNKNLCNWQIITVDTCPACDRTHNIAHMLYECEHAKRLWSIVFASTGLDISINNIILPGQTQEETFSISVISFLIYKLYINKEKENAYKHWKNYLRFYSRELKHKIRIYNTCKTLKFLTSQLCAVVFGIDTILGNV